MGHSCSRRQQIVEVPPEDEWLLFNFPGIAQANIRKVVRLYVSSGRKNWIRLTSKIALLRHLRIRWSRAGSWLNLNPLGTVRTALRQRVSRAWAHEVKELLRAHHTAVLFNTVGRRRRVARLLGVRTRQPPGTSLRAAPQTFEPWKAQTRSCLRAHARPLK